MKKRISSLLLALVMCLSLLPTAAFAEGDTDTDPDGGTTITDMDAADTPMVQSVASQPAVTAAEHSHCICGTTHSAIGDHSAENVQTWTSTTSLPASAGCYCLQNSVTLSSTWSAPAGNVYLCLNGYTITAGGDFPVITVTNGATLYLTDCQGTGKITHNTGNSGSGAKVESGGNFSLFNGSITGNTTDNGGGVYIASGGTFSLYGGSITGNTATGQDVAEGGGGVYIEDSSSTPGGTFNMYGGSITGNTATGTESQSCGGGGIFVGNYGTFKMTGGEISGNHAANKGGGVYIVEPADNHINFTMSGGEITGNNAAGLGGGVYGAGAYHAIDSTTNPPALISTPGNTFIISGNAEVIGNTLGGAKGTDGKYTGDTANNMYLPSWVFSIHVASDFTGSFGVTVAEDDWARPWDGSTGSTRKGSLWQVVRYEGTSDFPGFNYDNQHFTLIKRGDDRGMLQCNHYNSTSAVCAICGAALNVEMTIAPKPPEDDAPANDTPNTPHRHDPIRRQPLFISAIGDSGNASGSGSGVASPDTGDAGIALYGAMAVLSLTGGAWVRRRKKS